jgi:dienelactone hydrolase
MGLAVGSVLLFWATAANAAVPYSSITVSVPSTTSGAPQDLPATLLKPEGDGPFPAIVLLHDCSGLGAHSSGAPGRWGALLAAEDYVVIIPDSFTPRGYGDGVCTVSPAARTDTVNPQPRAVDAYATLAFLRRQTYIGREPVGVMGGSHGGATTLAVDVAGGGAAIAADPQIGFTAAIAFYPGCGARFGGWSVRRSGGAMGPVTQYFGVYQPLAPLLILVGEKDDWTPAADCQALAEHAQQANYPVTIKVYSGAWHSFDSANPIRYLDNRRNLNKPDGHGATTGGDPAAWADSIAQVQAFFARYLKD